VQLYAADSIWLLILLPATPVVVLSVFLIARRYSAGSPGGKQKAGSDESKEWERVLGELAHEIKNPVSTIKINLRLISEQIQSKWLPAGEADKKEIDSALRKISVIEKENDRLGQILEDFVKFARPAQPRFSSVDINELVTDMIDFYQPQAHKHSIAIKSELYSRQLFCKIDPDMLKQVLLNLFINAREAMSGGGELVIRTGKKAGNVLIEVQDTGVGIGSDDIANIFDAYYSARKDGSGLGLATAKRVITAHRGTIEVKSEPGKGSLFTIRLPFSQNVR